MHWSKVALTLILDAHSEAFLVPICQLWKAEIVFIVWDIKINFTSPLKYTLTILNKTGHRKCSRTMWKHCRVLNFPSSLSRSNGKDIREQACWCPFRVYSNLLNICFYLPLHLYLRLYLRLYLPRAVSGERCGLLQILETNRDSGRVGEAAISNSKRVAESKWIGRDKRWLESKSQEISSLIEEAVRWKCQN